MTRTAYTPVKEPKKAKDSKSPDIGQRSLVRANPPPPYVPNGLPRGRKPGQTAKLTAADILRQCEKTIGKPFVESLMEGYLNAIVNNDKRYRALYENMLLNKVATQLMGVEVNDTEEVLDNKRQVFSEALAIAMQNSAKNSNTDPNNLDLAATVDQQQSEPESVLNSLNLDNETDKDITKPLMH